MDILSPKLARRMFIASSIMMVVAVALSVLNTAQVLSAPLRTTTTVPDTVGFEGFIAESNGQPIADGEYQLTFRVRDQFDDIKWTEPHNNVQVTNGLYSVILGVATPFDSETFNGERWIGVTVGTGAEITPRTKVSSVPFALNADNANKIGGGGVAGMVAAFDGACPQGWTEFAAAQGRVVVGVPMNGDLGGTVGTALGDKENRTHTHIGGLHQHTAPVGQWPGNSSVQRLSSVAPFGTGESYWSDYSVSVSTGNGSTNNTVGLLTSSGGDVSTGASSSNIPYIQLRYCKLNP